jgi:hypothetical protein
VTAGARRSDGRAAGGLVSGAGSLNTSSECRLGPGRGLLPLLGDAHVVCHASQHGES